MENCTVNADIYCSDAHCGGIVGLNRGTVQDCAFSGSVTCPEEDALSCDLGGIVGYNSGKVGSCANSGVISCASLDGSVGGIVGSHTGGEIRECENTGAVTGGESAGGIVGLGFLSSIGGDLKDEQADIVDCQNSGAVSTAGEYAGGIAGQYMLDDSDFAMVFLDSGCVRRYAMYSLILNEDGYIAGFSWAEVFTTIDESQPFVDNLDGIDLQHLQAYKYIDGAITLDSERLAKVIDDERRTALLDQAEDLRAQLRATDGSILQALEGLLSVG